MEIVAGEQGLALQQLFPYKSSYFLKIHTVVKSHSIQTEASNLAILVFSICSFHFLHSLSYSPQQKFFKKKCGHVTPAAKGLFVSIIEIRSNWHFKTRQDVNTVNIAFHVVFCIAWMFAARSKVQLEEPVSSTNDPGNKKRESCLC